MMARSKTGKYKALPMVGLFIGTLVYTALIFVGERLPLWGYIACLVVANAAVGSTFPVTTVVVQNVVERHEMGTATGVMNFFRSLGGAIMVAVFGAILFGELYSLLGSSFSGALTAQALDHVADPARIYRPIFIGAAIAMGLAFLLMLSMEEKPLKSRDLPVAKAIEEANDVLDGADFSEPQPKK